MGDKAAEDKIHVGQGKISARSERKKNNQKKSGNKGMVSKSEG